MRTLPRPRRPLRTLALLPLLAACGAGGQAHAPAIALAPVIDTGTAAPVAAVRQAAVPLTGAPGDYDALMVLVGDARVVLLGEGTHGTHEFYRERARITQRLIREKGFTAVAVEGDWPRAARVDRYVRGTGADPDAARALSGFTEFPQWMWRNADVRDFVEALRAHNRALPAGAERVGFYGLDLYAITPAADAVVGYLERVDPEAARAARRRYGCFARFRDDPQGYGQSVEYDDARSCQDEAAEALRDVQRVAAELPGRTPTLSRGEVLDLERSAHGVVGGEAYFRELFRGGVSTWNLRDRHMAATLDALLAHLDRDGRPGKVVVWAHNTHVGDARATHMADEGEVNLGQLARERYGDSAVVLVGFTTYTGTVIAAHDWGGRGERREVRPSLPGSYGAVFHETGIPAFLLPVRGAGLEEPFRHRRLQRAIGVVYLPGSERVSHYFHAHLPTQFDAVIHLDQTRAVEPLR